MQALTNVRTWIAHACAILAVSLFGVWMIGRVVSDRTLLSQFFSWIPTLAVVLGLAGLLGVRAIVIWKQHDAVVQDTARSKLLERLVPGLFVGVAAAWWLIVDLGVLHFARSGPATISMRILAWNMTTISNEEAADGVSQTRPDIALLANTRFQASLVPVRVALGEAARSDGHSDKTYAATSIRLNIISRFPMLHSAWMPLGISGARERTFTWPGGGMKHIDVGEVIMAELDTREALGRTMIVWLVDLPSDPDIPRSRMMRQARATIDAFASDVLVRTVDGLDRALTPGPERDAVLARLRTPDIVGGDFNTPYGSWSIGQLVGSMRHARETAVNGGSALSYPRGFPILHIDHVFLREPLVAGSYRIIDPGMGRHKAQVVDIGTKQ